jgi:putative phosphoesterase
VVAAVIADTHMPRGSRRLSERCLEAIAAADLLVHAGDFSSAAFRDELATLGPPLIAVHGNVDDAQLRRELPERTTFELGPATIAVIHDAGPKRGRLARMRREFPAADAVVFGHSHLPLLEREERDEDAKDGFAILNPGSPTERRRAPAHTMAVIEARDDELSFRHLEV